MILLKSQDYDVAGVTMKPWSDDLAVGLWDVRAISAPIDDVE